MSAELEKWMRSSNMALPDSLAVDVFPCGTSTIRGMRATRDICRGEVLLKVPYVMFLNADNALTSLPELEESLLRADTMNRQQEEDMNTPASKCWGPSFIVKSEFVMGCYLVKCYFDPSARAASPFRPLLDLLPKPSDLPMVDLWLVTEFDSSDVHLPEFVTSHSASALSLGRDQMVALLGSQARFLKLARRVERLRQRYLEAKRRYFDVAPDFFDPSVFTFAHWLWAMAIVNSRSFQYSRPKFSDYPTRYASSTCGEDDDSEDEEEEEEEASDEDEEEGEAVDDDALVKACERAVARAKRSSAVSTSGGGQSAALHFYGKSKPRQRRTIGTPDDESSDDDDEAARDVADRVRYSRIPTEEESAADAAMKDLYTLLPLADMFNHDEGGTQDFQMDAKSKCFVIKSDREFFSGDQVVIKYNSMDHWRFAKYYGFVSEAPPATSAEPSACNRNDAFPIAVPLPPHRTAAQPNASVLEVTKTLLFEDPLLRKHCYVTSKGPNQSLLSALRLIHLGESDFDKYTFAFQKDMISVRNEWHAFKFLLDAVNAALGEVKRHRNALNSAGTSGLSERAQVAVAVRERDFRVLSAAQKVCQSAFKNLCELMYYGAAADSVLRSNAVHEQLEKLRSLQRVPLTASEQEALGLSHLPIGPNSTTISNPFRTDQFGVDDLVDVLHKRLTQRGRKPSSDW